MTWKTKNNKPMEQDKAFEKFIEYGYIPLENYTNNMVKIPCLDSEGYIVMIARNSLGRVQQYQRFSITANPDYYVSNMNLYGQKNNIPSIVLDYNPSKTKNHVDILCRCSCGKEFVCDANNWKRLDKTRCNSCTSKLSNIEKIIQDYLIENNVEFISQKRFEECKDIRTLPFDFYLPLFNICIEVDGEQHYTEHSKFYQKSRGSIEDRIKKDNIKTQYCIENNIELIRIKYSEVRNNQYKNILINKLNIH